MDDRVDGSRFVGRLGKNDFEGSGGEVCRDREEGHTRNSDAGARERRKGCRVVASDRWRNSNTAQTVGGEQPEFTIRIAGTGKHRVAVKFPRFAGARARRKVPSGRNEDERLVKEVTRIGKRGLRGAARRRGRHVPWSKRRDGRRARRFVAAGESAGAGITGDRGSISTVFLDRSRPKGDVEVLIQQPDRPLGKIQDDFDVGESGKELGQPGHEIGSRDASRGGDPKAPPNTCRRRLDGPKGGIGGVEDREGSRDERLSALREDEIAGVTIGEDAAEGGLEADQLARRARGRDTKRTRRPEERPLCHAGVEHADVRNHDVVHRFQGGDRCPIWALFARGTVRK